MNDRRSDPKRPRNGRRAPKSVDDVTCGVHESDIALSASDGQAEIAQSQIEIANDSAQSSPMLSTSELLSLLSDRGIKKAAIARVLGIDPAGVTRLYSGERGLYLDEARKLVDAFKLPVDSAPPPLTIPIARLLVLHGAEALGAELSPDDPRVQELAQDFRAFSMFATDPRVRESTSAVEGFFQGLRLGVSRSSEP
jgi:antitoxin component HigA of HigAB toxin-antitoxin module